MITLLEELRLSINTKLLSYFRDQFFPVSTKLHSYSVTVKHLPCTSSQNDCDKNYNIQKCFGY